jgi:hypothetical protein
MESGAPYRIYQRRRGEGDWADPSSNAPGSAVLLDDLAQSHFDSAQSRFDRALPALLWIAVCGYMAFTAVGSLAAPVGKFDDAIPLVHGTLVQQGRTPNLDFYSFYPPLSLYLNAAVFSILGRSVIAERLVAGAFYVAFLLLTGWFFSSRYRTSGPLVPAAVLLIATSIGGLVTLPSWEGFALSLAAVLTYLCSHGLRRHRLWVVAGAGVLTALAILCRINFGGYAAAVIVLDLLLQRIGSFDDGQGADSPSLLATSAAFAAPAAVCVAGGFLAIYGRDIGFALSEFIVTAQRMMALRGFITLRLDAFVACTVMLPPLWFSFRMLKGDGRIPAMAFVPAAVAVLMLLVTLLGRAHFSIAPIVVALEIASVVLLHVFVHRLERAELSVLLFFSCALHYFLSRMDWDHWRILPVAAAFLLPLLVMSRHEPGRTRYERTTAKGTAFAVMAAAIILLVSSTEFRTGFSWFPKGVALLGDLVRQPHAADSDRALGPSRAPQWAALYQDEDEVNALRYVRARTSPSTPIFVGVKDHSRVFWNNLRMYWLSGRPIGVKTFQLETRMATEAAVQQEIVDDLERNQVAWIILDNLGDGDEVYVKADYQGSELLDRYIATHFAQQAAFGPYMILTRRS